MIGEPSQRAIDATQFRVVELAAQFQWAGLMGLIGMRVATFNLESLDDTTTADVPLEVRIELLLPQLERLEADVLCLQEVNGQRRHGDKRRALHALDELLRDTPYSTFQRATTKGPTGDIADVHNLVILSRWPIRSHRQIHHELVPPVQLRLATAQQDGDAADHEVSFDRPILLAVIETPEGKPLHVFNVHLRAPLATSIPGQKEAPFVWRSVSGWAEGYFLSEIKRCGQALELRLAIDRILDGDREAAIIVCGDFNAEANETPLEIVIGAEEDTGNGLLAWRSLVLLDRALSADRRFSVLHHGRPQMLDHILASRRVWARVRGLEVHNEALEDELVVYGRVRNAAGSCHAPVVALISMP